MNPSTKFTKAWRHALTDYGTALCWSPDGDWLAAASAVGEVVLYDPSGQATVLCPPGEQAINALGFSADGQWLAAAGQAGQVQVWPLRSLNQPPVLNNSHPGIWIDQLVWHPQLPLLAYGIGSQVQVWAMDAPDPLAELEFQDSSVLHLSWHPTANLLAVSGHGGIKVWSGEDWQAAPQTIAVPGASLYTDWSADGRYLGSGNLDHTLTVAEWGQPPPWLMQGFPGKVRQIAWSQPLTASGSPLVAAACVEGITVWEREPTPKRGWRSRVLQHHRQRVNGIAFQPQSLQLASAGEDGIICLWQQGKTLAQTLKFPQGGCSTLAWNPQGHRLAVAGTQGDLVLWQLSSTQAKGFG